MKSTSIHTCFGLTQVTIANNPAISGLNASTFPVLCCEGAAICTKKKKNALKGQYNIDTHMPKYKFMDGEERHPCNYRGCKHYKEKMRKRMSQRAHE
jgi:hypothetical protein